MPKIEIDGHRFHYQQSGAGPDVVLVHAFTANMSVWMFTGIVDELSRDFRVTMYDLRGHGHSDVTAGGYSSLAMARDLAGIHEKLGLSPAFLVGHSYGGVIAVHAAAEFSEMVRGIALSDSYFPALARLEPNMPHTDVWQDLRETFAAADADLGEQVDFGRLFRTIAGLSPEQNQAVAEKIGPAGARWISQLGRLAETTAGEEMFHVAGLTEERIRGLAQPVYALYDEHSPFLATCRFLQESVARCTVDFIPQARHIAPLQNSGVFVEKVSRWLRDSLTDASVSDSNQN